MEQVYELSSCDALELIDYWNYCPPEHISRAVQTQLLRSRPEIASSADPLTDFQQLSTTLPKNFRGGVQKMPAEYRGMIDWAESIKKKINGPHDS